MNAAQPGDMNGPAPVPRGVRIQFAHHHVRLPDGRRAGVSVGGHGVPLVFFHGIGLHRQVYLKLLSRLPQLGFLVVAIDAPGHGDTFVPSTGQDSFAHRMDVTETILDALGIQQAVLLGHSMGGRTAAELAARHPERALAVILVDPAVGGAFDASRARIASPVKTAAALTAALGDTVRERVGFRRLDRLRYLRTLSKLFRDTATHPRAFAAAATAIAGSEDSATALRALRAAHAHVVVIHGEKDMIVPIESAIEAAALSGAELVTLPQAYHSWVLTTPWTFVDIMCRLIAEQRLGADLMNALAKVGREVALCANELYRPGASVLAMSPELTVLGAAAPRQQKFYHDYRIWHSRDIEKFGG